MCSTDAARFCYDDLSKYCTINSIATVSTLCRSQHIVGGGGGGGGGITWAGETNSSQYFSQVLMSGNN